MSDPLRTPDDYELFTYTLTEQFLSVRGSTVTFVRLGATLALVSGELRFDHNIRLVVRPQPHPDDSVLASSQPHHKHISPNIKHNRVPAPEMSFSQPNLPVLIQEIEGLIEAMERGTKPDEK
jgi:hypothetical protein